MKYRVSGGRKDKNVASKTPQKRMGYISARNYFKHALKFDSWARETTVKPFGNMKSWPRKRYVLFPSSAIFSNPPYNSLFDNVGILFLEKRK